MRPEQLHRRLKTIQRFSAWYLVVIAVTLSLVSLFSLRHNNQRSVDLRNQVYQVDQQNGDIEAALQKLRQHIYSHMGSGLSVSGGAYPPIQLKYRYERLVAAQKQATNAASSQVYTAAQNYCEQRFPVGLSGSGRIPCIEDYVSSHQAAALPTIPDALYKFDFAAPLWSPDLAGISLALAAVCWLVVLVSWLVSRALAHRLD